MQTAGQLFRPLFAPSIKRALIFPLPLAQDWGGEEQLAAPPAAPGEVGMVRPPPGSARSQHGRWARGHLPPSCFWPVGHIWVISGDSQTILAVSVAKL